MTTDHVAGEPYRAAVTRDLPMDVVAVDNPARAVRENV